MNSRIALSLNAGAGNPRNSEGSFVTLKDGRILFAYSRYRGESNWGTTPLPTLPPAFRRTAGGRGRLTIASWSPTKAPATS